MATTIDETVRRAFQRAHGRSALVHYLETSQAGYAVYAVDSTASTDTAYVVTVAPSGQFRCTCPAADLGRPACWHRAAVATVRASRTGFGLPADGPTAEQERADVQAAARQALARIEAMFAA